MKDRTNATGSSVRRRSFIYSSAVAGAVLGGIGTVQASEDNDGGTFVEPPEDEDVEPQDVEYQDADDAAAVIFKHCEPWEVPGNEVVLDEMDIDYGVLPAHEASDINEFPVNIAIIPSTQDQEFYDRLVAAREEIREWVSNGGVLIVRGFSQGWPCNGEWPARFLPQDVDINVGNVIDELEFAQPDHPVVDNLDARFFDGWAAGGDLQNLPDDVNLVYGAHGRPRDRPSYIDYAHGSGRVLATLTPSEWAVRQGYGIRHMVNEFAYAMEGGGDVPEDDTAISLSDLSVESTIEGEAAQGELIQLSATAENVGEEPIEADIGVGFDDEVFEAISNVPLDPGAAVDVVTDFDVGTVTSPGETVIGYTTQQHQEQQALGDLSSSNDISHSAAVDEIDTDDDPLPSQLNADATALLIKDSDPWDEPANEILMQELGVEYARVNSDDLGQVDFTNYTYILIPSHQADATMDTVAEYDDQFDTFVSNGGVLIAHLCSRINTNPDFLPEGVGTVRSLTDEISIEERTPVVDEPERLTDADLSGWNASVHDYLTGVSDGMRVVTREANNNPAYVEYEHGSGVVLASTHTMEWPFAQDQYGTPDFLINELLYAFEGEVGDGVPDQPTDTISTEFHIRELGDATHSGSVEITDAVSTQQYVGGDGDPAAADQFNPAAADLTQDGTVDARDVELILDKVVGNAVNIEDRPPSVEDAGLD